MESVSPNKSIPFFRNGHFLYDLFFFFCGCDGLINRIFSRHDFFSEYKYSFARKSDIIIEFFEIDSRCRRVTPLCPSRESCYLCLVADDFIFSYTKRLFSLRIIVSRNHELYHEKREKEDHTDEYIVFVHSLPERDLERFVHFMYWKLCVHCFICELISVFISLTKNRSKCCFFKTR